MGERCIIRQSRPTYRAVASATRGLLLTTDPLTERLMKITPRSEAKRYWEDVLRPLLRYAILCGDVAVKNGGYDTPLAYGNQGLDTDRRLAHIDIVVGMWKLQAADPQGYDLVRRSIGIHCDNERCPLGVGHWHSQSWMDLVSGQQTREMLHARLEEALAFLVAYCNPK